MPNTLERSIYEAALTIISCEGLISGKPSPTAFRVTPQWFINMDQAGLRANALESIKHIR